MVYYDLWKKHRWKKHRIIGGMKMAYKISDECISCGSCESECPVEAISAGDAQYQIDADTCVDCGACVSSCPVEAISE